MTADSVSRIPVDLTNPGQFFACCGLLELSHRVDIEAVGWFESGYFVVNRNLSDVLDRMFKCDVRSEVLSADDEESGSEVTTLDPSNPHRGRTYPMTLGAPFNLRLDWWTSDTAQKQKLKTWTAGQRVTDLFLGFRKGKKNFVPPMRDHFAEVVKQSPHDWLRMAIPIEAPMAFSFDSRLSRNNALDQGHTERSVMAFSPAVDVLTLVGLQRFRPRTIETWTRNFYCSWNEPLSVEIAAVAAYGLIPAVMDRCFEFPVKPRDAQGRFKLFGHAQPVRKPDA